MNLYIDGFRSHNIQLSSVLSDAAYFYGEKLLGKRMLKNITIEIKLTRELKQKEKAYGLCHIIDDDLNRPREFMIELDASMKWGFDQILIWLAHEMVHLKQFVRKELFDYEYGATQWKSRLYSMNKIAYYEQPWEKEAYRLETKLFEEFEESYE